MRRIALIALPVATALAVAATAFGATILNNPTHKFDLAFSKKALAATSGSVTLRSKNTSAVLKHNIAIRKRREGDEQAARRRARSSARTACRPSPQSSPRGSTASSAPSSVTRRAGCGGSSRSSDRRCRARGGACRSRTRRHGPDADRRSGGRGAAWSRLVRQVRLGPRPAGSPASRKLATQLKAELPSGSVPGRARRLAQRRRLRARPRSVTDGRRRRALRHEGPARVRGRERRRGRDGARRRARAKHRAEGASPVRHLHPLRRRGVAGRPAGLPGDRPAREQGGCSAVQERRGDDPARLRRRSRSLAAAGGLLGSGTLAAATRGCQTRGHRCECFRRVSRGESQTTISPSSIAACPRSISSTSTSRAGTGRATTSRACRSAASTRSARPCTSSYEASSSSTRRRMSSRITRTSSSGSPIGSRISQSI